MADRTRKTTTKKVGAKKAAAKKAAAKAPATIDAFLASKQHPLAREIDVVREVVRGVDPSIREEIKWNTVSFRNDRDFFATVHLRSTSTLQLVFHTGVEKKATAQTGVDVDDPSGLIDKWMAKDRCLVTLGSGAAFEANRDALAAFVRAWIRFV